MIQQKAREILDKYELKVSGTPEHWKKTKEREALDSELLSQLFEATVAILTEPVLNSLWGNEDYLKGRQDFRKEMLSKLRVFFDQPEEKS
jgi:hypothetical protein